MVVQNIRLAGMSARLKPTPDIVVEEDAPE